MWVYYIGYGPIAVNFESSHYHVNEADGSLKVNLVASKPPNFVFYVRLDALFHLRIKGSLGMYTVCLDHKVTIYVWTIMY